MPLHPFFLSCRKGISSRLLLEELRLLVKGLPLHSAIVTHNGVEAAGDFAVLQKCTQYSRLAESVWLRIHSANLPAGGVEATLQEALLSIPWENYFRMALLHQILLRVVCIDAAVRVADVKQYFRSALSKYSISKRVSADSVRDKSSPIGIESSTNGPATHSVDADILYGSCIAILLKQNLLSVELKASGRLVPRPFLYLNAYYASTSIRLKESTGEEQNRMLLADEIQSIQHHATKRVGAKTASGVLPNANVLIHPLPESAQKLLARHYSRNYIEMYAKLYDASKRRNGPIPIAAESEAAACTEEGRTDYTLSDREVQRIHFLSSQPKAFASPMTDTMASQFLFLCRFKKLLEQDRDVVIWDPFCGIGNILFEMLSLALHLPVLSQATPLPYMYLKPFHQQVEGHRTISAMESAKNLPNITLIGSDTNAAFLEEAYSRLHHFYNYYKDPYFRNTPPPQRNTAGVPQTPTFTDLMDRRGLLFTSPGPHILRHSTIKGKDDVAPSLWPMPHRSLQGAPQSSYTHPPQKTLFNSKDASIFKELEDGIASFEIKGDDFGNYSKALNVYLIHGDCNDIAPFINKARIITFLPGITALNKHSQRRIRRMYKGFCSMITANMDIRDVYVATVGTTFRRNTFLKWKELRLPHEEGSRQKEELSFLRWTGIIKTNAGTKLVSDIPVD